jgi:hypothetical protein
MFLIAFSAVVMAALVYHRRRASWVAYTLDRQRYHARWEMVYRDISVMLDRDATEYARKLEVADLPEAKRKRLRYLLKSRIRSTRTNAELSEFHGRMRVKWAVGGGNLWLRAEPDPPSPD